MKGFDFAAGLSNPAYIAGISGLNPLAGKQLVQQASLQREQKQENRAEEKHNFEKTKFLREEEAAKAMLQQFGDVDFDNPQKALQQLQEKNVPADAALLLIHKAIEIKNAKEGVDIQRGQLGVQQGQLGVSQGQLGLNQQELGLKRQELAAKLAGAGQPDAEQAYKITKDLRESATKAAENYKFVRTAAKNVRSLAKIGTGISDTGMLYNTVNVLDPGNSVREGDVITVKTAPGLSEEMIGFLNSLRGKGKFSPQTRLDLVQLVDTVENNHLGTVKNVNKENKRLAEAYKVRPDLATYPLEDDAEDFQVNSQEAPGVGFNKPTPSEDDINAELRRRGL